MGKEALLPFGLESLTGAFVNIAIGIGALAIGASILKETFKTKKHKK